MEEKSFDYMNVIPLVDVMMVLLVIVLMTSTFIADGLIPVDLPKSSQDPKQVSLTVTVVVDRTGAVHIDGTPVAPAQLRDKLGPVEKQTPVLIRADRHLPVQTCVDIMDALTSLGFTKIALQTERP